MPGSQSVSTTTYHPSLITILQKLRWIYFSSPIDGVAVLTDTLGAMAAIIIEREGQLEWINVRTAGAHNSIPTNSKEMKDRIYVFKINKQVRPIRDTRPKGSP